MLLAKNVQAGRLIAGFTISEPGNWTSWPPHEHAAMLEEMYLYFKMPAPAFAIQLVYNDTEYPELVTVVRDGDAVLMPSGYRPNVSVPGHRICFLWAMAAHCEVENRQFGVVNILRGFDHGSSSLEACKKTYPDTYIDRPNDLSPVRSGERNDMVSETFRLKGKNALVTGSSRGLWFSNRHRSSASDYLHGHILAVDGGWLGR
jgi:hypothetical protein